MDPTTIDSAKVRKYLPRLAALQNRNFRLLWIGKLISLAGTQMQLTTINWHIYILTGSAVALGMVGLAQVVPLIIFSFAGGIFADTYDRRHIMLLTQSIMMLFAVLLGLVTVNNSASMPFIYLITALTACVKAFDSPAHQSLVPNLVPKEHLRNALSLTSLTRQLAMVIGPAIAGYIIAGLGMAVVYWINAVSFLAVIVALLLIRTSPQPNVDVKRTSPVSFVEGIQFIRNSKIILATMLLDFFATFFSSASALLPIFAHEILRVGPEGLGVLYAMESIGAFIAGTAMSLINKIKRQGLFLLGMVIIYGIATVLFGISQWFLLSLILLIIVGMVDMISTILRDTISQVSTPDHLRGRMISVTMIFFLSGSQLGNFEAGILATFIGTQGSVILGGVATVILAVIVMWLAPQIRNYHG